MLNKTMAQNFLNSSIDSSYRSNGSSLDRQNQRNAPGNQSGSREQSLDFISHSQSKQSKTREFQLHGGQAKSELVARKTNQFASQHQPKEDINSMFFPSV